MTPNQFYDLAFPFAGIDQSVPFYQQVPRQMKSGEWGRTTRSGINVRGFEPGSERMRGGGRAGLARYVSAQLPAGVWVISDLALMVTDLPVHGGSMQLSQAGRIVTVVAVQQGNVSVAQAGDTAWTATVNNTGQTPPLNYTGILFSAPNQQKLYFADGVNWCYYDPAINTVQRWTPTAGTFPVDTRGNTPRLIETWRGRTVLSGLLFDPQNWFMSAVGDPTDWDYAPVDITPTQAVAGNNSPLGQVGDVVTSMCPYNDDVLIFFGDHTIWLMNGDPMAGGTLSLVTNSIGGVWGRCWTMDPYGSIYFVSNRTGIYTLVPGQQPQRISQPVEQLINDVDTGQNTIRLLWNDRFQGLHVFVSPTTAPSATTHLFWEQRTGSWWQDQFANTNHDPLCCCIFDGNLPGDRVALLGSWDGYVRSVSQDAVDDDGTAIASSVVLGPITSKNLDEFLLLDLQPVLGLTSGSLTYQVYVGPTAEGALSTTPVASGVWTGGRSLNALVRRSGHAVYVKLSATTPWSMEVLRARIAGLGKVRRRGA